MAMRCVECGEPIRSLAAPLFAPSPADKRVNGVKYPDPIYPWPSEDHVMPICMMSRVPTLGYVAEHRGHLTCTVCSVAAFLRGLARVAFENRGLVG